jgi:hypothetical protein
VSSDGELDFVQLTCATQIGRANFASLVALKVDEVKFQGG